MKKEGADEVAIDITREDIRSIKTDKALNIAMTSLLRSRKFGRITVRDICEKAMISRATFYAHYTDKYDLLRSWLKSLKSEYISEHDTYEQREAAVDRFLSENISVLKNVISEFDSETLSIIFDSIRANLVVEEDEVKEISTRDESIKSVVLSNFYAGGMISYLMWQVENNFPADVPLMNMYLCKVMRSLMEIK